MKGLTMKDNRPSSSNTKIRFKMTRFKNWRKRRKSDKLMTKRIWANTILSGFIPIRIG